MEVTIRRKLAGLAALVSSAVAACSPGTGRQLQELYDNGTKELLLGELDRARKLTDQGLRLSRTVSPICRGPGSSGCSTTRFASSIARLSEPFPGLDEALPETTDYGWVRARQRFLKGQHHLVKGELPEAVATFDDSARRAKSLSATDVLIDADILKGVALLRLGRVGGGRRNAGGRGRGREDVGRSLSRSERRR